MLSRDEVQGRLLRCGVLGIIVAVLGCSGGSGSGAPKSARATIGGSGGSVVLPGAVTVEVPAGVLTSSTDLTVQQSGAVAPASAVTPVFAFGPDGATFASPVTVHFTVPAGTTAAAVFWSKPGSSTEYESVPTTIEGTTATAQVSHFSSGYVATYDLAGAWAGGLDYAEKDPSGAPAGTGSVVVTDDVTQSGGVIDYVATSSSGFSGTCHGTISGTHVSTTCQLARVDGGCTLSIEAVEEIQPGATISKTVQENTTLGGTYCAGYTETAQGTLTKQAAPPVDVSGTWVGSLTYVDTDPSGTPQPAATGQETKTVTQTGSKVTMALQGSSGATGSCVGTHVGDTVSYWCHVVHGGCVLDGPSTEKFSGTPPATTSFSYSFTGYGSCAGWTEAGTGSDTRQ
jgi:hypothetical protein